MPANLTPARGEHLPQRGRVACRIGWGATLPDTRPTINVPMPREIRESETPKVETPLPGPVKPRPCSPREMLRLCLLCGRAEVETFAASEQAKRDQTAAREWTRYRLVGRAGCRWGVAVQNPNGARYALDVTTEGVKRFVGCVDQAFVDEINAALRAVGSPFRVETKHAKIWFLRERAKVAGLIDWEEA